MMAVLLEMARLQHWHLLVRLLPMTVVCVLLLLLCRSRAEVPLGTRLQQERHRFAPPSPMAPLLLPSRSWQLTVETATMMTAARGVMMHEMPLLQQQRLRQREASRPAPLMQKTMGG